MDGSLGQYLYLKRIDNFQKLHFLLFLYQHPQLKETCEEFANRLYFGDTVLLKKIIVDLQFAGLVERIGNRYKLCDEPRLKSQLRTLAGTFEDPLTRQELLDLVQGHVPYSSQKM